MTPMHTVVTHRGGRDPLGDRTFGRQLKRDGTEEHEPAVQQTQGMFQSSQTGGV